MKIAFSPVFQDVFPFAAFVFFFLVLLAFEYLGTRKQRQALKIIAQQFWGSCSKVFVNCSFKGKFQGIALSIVYAPARKNSPAYLRIALEKDSRLKLRVYRESFISRAGKKMRLVREVEIFDGSFDKDFLIFSNDPGGTSMYLSSPDRKNAIKELFTRGFESLIIDGRKLLIQKTYSYKNDSLKDLSLQKVKEVLDLLFKLTAGI